MQSAIADDDRWIGQPISLAQVWVIMLVGCSSAVVTAVAPLTYARMVVEGRLHVDQIGRVATVEYMMLALTATVAGIWLGADRIRLKLTVALLVFTIANLASAWADYPGILLTRMLAGVCDGMFAWLMANMYARSTLPARLQGMYLALQGSVGFVMSAAYGHVILPSFGGRGGFVTLAILSLLVAAAVRILPRSFSPLRDGPRTIVLPSKAGVYGLLCIVLVFAGTVGIWFYLPALALYQRQAAGITGIAFPVALAMQVVGGLSAAALAPRLPVRRSLVVTWAVCIALALTLAAGPPGWLYVACTGLFGFCWMFFVPLQMSYVVRLDPSRRSLFFLGTAQPLGAAAGPAVVALAIVGGGRAPRDPGRRGLVRRRAGDDRDRGRALALRPAARDIGGRGVIEG